MSLITIIVALIILGLVLWLVQSLLPIDAKIKQIIIILIVIVFIIWLAQGFGFL